MDERIIEEAIREQKEELELNLKKDFISRKEENLVDIESSLAQVVIGVRRSGKSTLCLNVLKSSKTVFGYINFDDERLANANSDDMNKILECLYKIYGNFQNLFIDEIQNVENWFLFVNRLLRQGMRILITGSNAKLLSGELATHLTGRHISTELYPFSFSELCGFKKIETQHNTTKSRGFIRAEFDEYLRNGGFPELINIKRKQTYINELVNNIVTNDIENRYSIKYKNAFEQIVHHLLNNSPAKINYKEIQKTFGINSAHTVENYVNYIKNAYLILGLHKYSAKSKIRIRNEKAYAVDVALMNNRTNAFEGQNLGWRLETIVYIELLRRYKPLEYDIYYFEETSCEVDFVLCKGNQAEQLIQVSFDISNPKTRKRETNALFYASEKLNCDNLLLITDHETEILEEKNKTIKIVPAYDWLLEEK